MPQNGGAEAKKRAIAFVDGQNLFHAAKRVFGHRQPNYDIASLCQRIAREQGWELVETRFYTGVPTRQDDPKWNGFWEKKLLQMSRRGVKVFKRNLKYREERVVLGNGAPHTFDYLVEKGVDVRLALDTVTLAYRSEYNVAIIFSQDQDLSEAAEEIRTVAKGQSREVTVVSAFPHAPELCDDEGASRKDEDGYDLCNPHGIGKTIAIKIPRETYDACLDLRDYHWQRRR